VGQGPGGGEGKGKKQREQKKVSFAGETKHDSYIDHGCPDKRSRDRGHVPKGVRKGEKTGAVAPVGKRKTGAEKISQFQTYGTGATGLNARKEGKH